MKINILNRNYFIAKVKIHLLNISIREYSSKKTTIPKPLEDASSGGLGIFNR